MICKKHIQEAREEALRFLARVAELEKVFKSSPIISNWGGCAQSGAVRRASMDLTRALAKLRKYDNWENQND